MVSGPGSKGADTGCVANEARAARAAAADSSTSEVDVRGAGTPPESASISETDTRRKEVVSACLPVSKRVHGTASGLAG